MFDTFQWLILATVVFLLSILLTILISDRYFGASTLGSLIQKKDVMFIDSRSLWVQRMMMYATITIIISIASLWPVLVLGYELLNEMIPYLLIFWGMMVFVSLVNIWGRDNPKEASEGQ